MALEKFNFSSDFQDLILASLCRFPDKFSGVSSILDFSFFTGVNSAAAAKLILDYHEAQGIFPSFTALGQIAVEETRKAASGDFSHDLAEYVKKLSEVVVRDVDYVRKSMVRFAQERALLIAAGEVGKLIQEGKEATVDVVEKFHEALTLGQNLDDMGYEIKEDAHTILTKLLDTNYGVATGFDLLDTKVFKHGMKPGWLIVPLAPPKSFKTTFCLNMATNIAGPSIGHDVVYYTCEISSELAAMRTYLRIAQKTEDDLYNDPRGFYEELERGLEMKISGRVFIKHFPAKTATINDIRAHLKALIAAKGIAPRVVFIDYADTIKADREEDRDDRKQAQVYTSARALGEEFGCVVVMPDRCNKETAEQAVPTMTSFQGSFEKGGIVDVAFGLCATPDEYRQSKIRLFFFLQRHGEAGLHFGGSIDAKRSTIYVNKQLEWNDLLALEAGVEERRNQRAGRRNGPARRRQPAGAIEG